MIHKVGMSWEAFNTPENLPREFTTGDHLGGFDLDGTNHYFDQLEAYASRVGQPFVLHSGQIFDDVVRRRYPHIDFRFSLDIFETSAPWNNFTDYTQHPDKNIQAFLSSFNGSAHVSRKLLVAALHRRGWFDSAYVSKNFAFTVDELDGHIADYVTTRTGLYRKMFIGANSQEFFESTNSFEYSASEHERNIRALENRLANTFINIVGETMATSMRPYITEKFLHSVITRGLFLTYGQPGWHWHLEHYYGFRKFSKIFSYEFDDIVNPVERLIAIMDQLSRFAVMSPADWQDLHELEHDTINFNYEHYFSGNYLVHLQQHFDPESGIYVNTHYENS
jgi:hypothetical protein